MTEVERLRARVEDLEYQLAELTTLRENDPLASALQLRRSERKALALLRNASGRIVPLDAIATAINPDFPSNGHVRVLVCELRRVLREAGAPVEIRTHWGEGYSLHEVRP